MASSPLTPKLLAVAMMVLSSTSEAAQLNSRNGEYEVQLLTPYTPARAYYHRGETWILGELGERYLIRVINHSGRRVEAVVSVDGRDVIDGRPADFASKRGYLIPAWGQIDIEGFRVSQSEVAAFRFARVADSYAARMGNARNVGVIGVAVFPERYVPPPPPYYPWWRAAPGPMASEAAPAPSGDKAAGAPAADEAASPRAKRAERPGLGTEFGESVNSQVQSVHFERAHPTRPAAILGMHYDDRNGLIAQGIDVDGWSDPSEVVIRRSASPFPDSQYATPPPGWHR